MRRLRCFRDSGGGLSLELALVLPLILLLMIGTIEYGLMQLGYAMLDSALFSVSRYGPASLHCGEQTAWRACISRAVLKRTKPLLRDGRLRMDISGYARFEDMELREPFYDANGSGGRDGDEYFVDMNDNRRWDGHAPNVLADDAVKIVLYRAVYAWPLMTPFAGKFLGQDGVVYLTSMAVARHDKVK